mmetsp:Transcript_28137/g.73771  ORF Transcript_28137/g.73771 Transcript_28137/m.73771 type:complete len:564 (+) Transcript_28137:110-1801(+)
MDLSDEDALLQAALAASLRDAPAAAAPAPPDDDNDADALGRTVSGVSTVSDMPEWGDDVTRTVSGTSIMSDLGWGSGSDDFSDGMEFDDGKKELQRGDVWLGTVMTSEELDEECKQVVSSLTEITELTDVDAYRLLAAKKWDVEVASALVYNPDHQAEVRRIVGSRHPDDKDGELDTCLICMERFEDGGVAVAPCGHRQCPDCLPMYVKVDVTEGGRGTLDCPMHRCTRGLPFATVEKCLTDVAKLTERMFKARRDEFVASFPSLAWCPGADCTKAVKVPRRQVLPKDSGCTPVQCTAPCSTRFCFTCQGEVHVPTSCKLMEMWMAKIDGDSASLVLIQSSTKECPFCGAAISKAGGCNSVSCRCGKEFCWLCLTSHNNHSFGEGSKACNRYDPAKEPDYSDYRKNVKRYLHYLERFENHKNGLTLQAQNFKAVTATVVESLAVLCGTEAARQTMDNAGNAMVYCRNTLACTYAFAFFLKSSSQQEIFEQNQEDLEVRLELLTQLVEKDAMVELAMTNPRDYYERVIKWTSYCESRAEVLLEHCATGYEKRFWEFLDRSLAQT